MTMLSKGIDNILPDIGKLPMLNEDEIDVDKLSVSTIKESEDESKGAINDMMMAAIQMVKEYPDFESHRDEIMKIGHMAWQATDEASTRMRKIVEQVISRK